VIVRAFVAVAGLWVAAILLAPLSIASGRPAFSLAAAGVYAAGSRVCHQRPDRCFPIDGRPMPVCARCTGLYIGAAVAGPLALLLASGWSTRRARVAVAVAALPTAVSWGLEYAGVAHPSNALRASLALPLGFVVAWLAVSTVHGPRARHRGQRDLPQGRMPLI
jgi:uncharacterized membrane protein